MAHPTRDHRCRSVIRIAGRLSYAPRAPEPSRSYARRSVTTFPTVLPVQHARACSVHASREVRLSASRPVRSIRRLPAS
jgi:hypothetical protein